MLFVRMCGGLGNQMFQYAYGRAVSRKFELPLCLDLSFYNAREEDLSDLAKITPLFRYNLKYDAVIRNNSELHASCGPLYHRYERLARFYDRHELLLGVNARFIPEKLCALFANKLLGVYICNDRWLREYRPLRSALFSAGYRQSERYFSEISDDICSELTLKDPVPSELEPMNSHIQGCEAVCMHVRRGDYTSSHAAPVHLVCTPQYYADAANYIKERVPNAVFFVFSDDPDWARENITLPGETVIIESGHPAEEDLRLMSACRHFAMSNSSYSWWAQYLSRREGRIVVAPSRWFANGLKTDIYQDFWRLIDC